MRKYNFLGSGMKFPPQINKVTGRFEVSQGEESVRESVYIILMTQKTERLMRPEFGSRIMSYAFTDTSVTRMNMMSRELRETILSQEPRISDVEVRIKPDLRRARLLIDIEYKIAESNTTDNLVFPFYLYAAAEGEEDGYTE